MSKPLASLLILAGLLVAALALNPSADKHRGKIKESVAERSQIEKVLGLGHLTAFASKYHSVGGGLIHHGQRQAHVHRRIWCGRHARVMVASAQPTMV